VKTQKTEAFIKKTLKIPGVGRRGRGGRTGHLQRTKNKLVSDYEQP